LPVRRKGPHGRRAADKREEIASPQRLTLTYRFYPNTLTVHGASQQIWMTDVR
jgi:hypothetical protein